MLKCAIVKIRGLSKFATWLLFVIHPNHNSENGSTNTCSYVRAVTIIIWKLGGRPSFTLMTHHLMSTDPMLSVLSLLRYLAEYVSSVIRTWPEYNFFIMGKFMVTLILGWLCITLEIRMLVLERLISSWAPAESYIQPSIEFLSENGPWYPKSVWLIGNIPCHPFFKALKYGVRIGFWSSDIAEHPYL